MAETEPALKKMKFEYTTLQDPGREYLTLLNEGRENLIDWIHTQRQGDESLQETLGKLAATIRGSIEQYDEAMAKLRTNKQPDGSYADPQAIVQGAIEASTVLVTDAHACGMFGNYILCQLMDELYANIVVEEESDE